MSLWIVTTLAGLTLAGCFAAHGWALIRLARTLEAFEAAPGGNAHDPVVRLVPPVRSKESVKHAA